MQKALYARIDNIDIDTLDRNAGFVSWCIILYFLFSLFYLQLGVRKQNEAH